MTITIFEGGKYILTVPDWARNVYLKIEELPYKEALCILRIYYRNNEAYCLYHPLLKHHTPWVDSMEELDKKYQDGEIDPLRGVTVYQPDMWGDPTPIKIYLEEKDSIDQYRRYRCEVNGKLKYTDFITSLLLRLRGDYPLVNWDFVHYKGKFVNWV